MYHRHPFVPAGKRNASAAPERTLESHWTAGESMQEDRGSNVQGTDAGSSGGDAGSRAGGNLNERERELRAKSMRKRENGQPEPEERDSAAGEED